MNRVEQDEDAPVILAEQTASAAPAAAGASPEPSLAASQADAPLSIDGEIPASMDPMDPLGATSLDGSFRDLKGKSARGALVTFASQGARFAISFGSQLVLAHLLMPAQFGLVAMATPVLGFVAIFTDFGLSQAVIQRETIDQEELSSLFWINVGLSIVLSLVIVAISPLVKLMFHEPRVGPIVIALGLLLPISGLTSQAMALLSRQLAFVSLASVDFTAAFLGAASAIVAAWLGAGYWALILQQAVISLVTLIMVWPLSKWTPSRPRIDPRVGSLLKFGSHLTTFNIVSYFTLCFDNVLVGILRGSFALGLFERAFKLVVQPLSQVTAPLGRVAMPMLSRMLNAEEDYRRAYLRMLQMVLLITTPAMLCASILARDVVLALLGRPWMGTAPILGWLSIAGAISAYTVASCWLLVTQGRVRQQMHCGFISSGLILVSLFCGLPWGPVGIATAYAIFAPAVHGIYVWVSTRQGPVNLGHVARASYPPLTAALASGICLWLLRGVTVFHPLPKVLIGATVAYGSGFLLLLCIPSGRRMLTEMWGMRSLFSKARAAA